MTDRFQQTRPAPPPIVWTMALIFAAFELAFHLGATGDYLRALAFSRLSFFDFWFQRVLAGEDVPFVFWTSFLTYGFLHGGLLHLLMNGAIFLALGGMLANALGPGRFLILFFASSAAGALVWGLLYTGDEHAQLVGASGAIFGFIGTLKRWEWRWIAATGAPQNRFWGTIIALTLLNVLLAFAGPGGAAVAWQAHLGGFVGGWLIAPALAPGRAGPSPI
ncbi:rhomboid family intramembrane serine protease [Pikeienuella piscinae]|uniref:Rhomboid family intramembrane serine protease n=1 Tax=Pikeienuella piscinae TaxID=2748098 RepID=A0A7L5BU30_9RHOB|nr:rhomboid family intramembrane serine protease [Pikeienuella piscinae]QIE55710.1 rhomboid family intramembrane serine protease [Pikeienuella piscinae]